MGIRIVVEISDKDLEYYRKLLVRTAKQTAKSSDSELLRKASDRLEKARRSGLSHGVQKRLDDLGVLIAMLGDHEWGLEGEHRKRIRTVMSYFANTLDAIPDDLPGLGYIDDTLMIELVLRELRDDLDAYRDFSTYRDQQEELRGKESPVTREAWLKAKRRQMFMRIERRRRERFRRSSGVAPTPGILAYRT